MLKEVMNDLWLARISSLSNEVGLYSLVQGRIHKLKKCVYCRPKSVFKDKEAVKCLSSLHDKYVIVPADKASNNIVFVIFFKL
jgi:hypothetical protein